MGHSQHVKYAGRSLGRAFGQRDSTGVLGAGQVGGDWQRGFDGQGVGHKVGQHKTLADSRTGGVQLKYEHDAPVNDVVIHPNQGELISCDQSGSVKIWDLSENTCTHELVSSPPAA
jgi:WD40 repeat protein